MIIIEKHNHFYSLRVYNIESHFVISLSAGFSYTDKITKKLRQWCAFLKKDSIIIQVE